MQVITVRNVHQALIEGLRLFQQYGEVRDSRNGKVVYIPGPVTTEYTRPTERVLFWAARDANPFFHFFESLWMLAGRDDAAFVSRFAKQMTEYSDDGISLHGAYGRRWRKFWSMDQLTIITQRLIKDPNDRRCVLTMWNPLSDLNYDSKDIPCNTHVYFSRNILGRLDMTVCCRSNDMIWGGYGANAVHFSVLQEWMAAAIDCKVGRYWQISNNYHAYLHIITPLTERLLTRETEDLDYNPYSTQIVQPTKLVQGGAQQWLEDCERFCKDRNASFKDPFFYNVAEPLWSAHLFYKEKRYDEALKYVDKCTSSDWRLACSQWIERRQAAHERAKDDGPTYEAK